MKPTLRRSNALLRAAATGALLALLAAALLAIDSARAQLPSDLELVVGLVDDSDDIIPPGVETRVRAELRFTAGNADSRGALIHEQLLLDCENLRVSAADLRLGGGFHWEDPDALGYRLDIEDQTFSLIKSADPADPIESPAGVTTPRPSFVVKAVAGKYLAGTARGSGAAEEAETHPNTAHLINLCGAEVAKIDPPAGTAAGSFGGVTLPHTNAEDALEMWAENDDTLWLFIGSRLDAVDDRDRVGRLHVYKADLSASPPTVTLETTLSPPSSEYLNKPGDDYPNYGHSVAVSGDGSTLAVSAPVMNGIGAVYVYSKPSGTGEDWGDITYAAGVKVTSVETPAWGDWSSASQIAATRPFNWLNASCNAYCMEVATLLVYGDAASTTYNGVGFGGYAGDYPTGAGQTSSLALSNNGNVLVVGAPFKEWGRHAPAPLRNSFPATSIPGVASTQYFTVRVPHGEAYVFVAPSGGWTAAPDATTGQTEIAAGADASSFAPASHYAPGPTRRIVDEDATLSSNFPWGNFFSNLRIGMRVLVTSDGSTIFAASHAYAYGYTKASASAWDGAGWTPSTFSVNPSFGTGGSQGGSAISPDATRLALANVGQIHTATGGFHTSNVCPLPEGEEDVGGRGGVYVFTRVGATWGGNAEASQTEVCSPQQAEGAHFGRSVHFTTVDSQPLMVISEPYSDSDVLLSRIWLLPLPGDTTTLTETRCRGELREGVYTRICPLKLPAGASLAVPEGTEEGPFTISGRVSVSPDSAPDPDPNPRALRGLFEGQIGVVRELAEAHLELDTDINFSPGTAADDRPYPSVISEGEFTYLRLRILNEHGMPTATGSVASVLVQTTQGGLTSRVEGGACAGASGRASCSIPGSAITATNSGALRIRLDHTGKAGEALVWATVFGADQGETPGQTLTTERITVTLAGPAAQLTISAPNAGVLSVNAESAEGAEQAGADTDRRDELTLTVGALDAQGNAVPLPTPEPEPVRRRINYIGVEVPPESAGDEPRQISLARLTGPDGKRVTRGVAIVWPVGGALTPKLDAAGHEFMELNVNRAADDPLAAGEYTLELQLGHNVLGQQTFTVAGPPAAIALSELQGAIAPGERFSVEATLTDADGNPVPDGTRVSWGDTPLGTFASIVQLSAQSTTTAGKASATYLALSPGRTTISAQAGQSGQAGRAGDLRDLVLATVADSAPPPPPPRLADSLAQPNTVGSNSWLGDQPVRASALLNELTEVRAVQVWQSGRWFRYSRAGDGASVDFTIYPGAVLWFGN